MKKKGFTLMELLAVIIILAIVALIATPIVLNVIEDARKSAAFSEANYIYSGIKSYCQNEESLFELNPNRTEERLCDEGLLDDINIIVPNMDSNTMITNIVYEDKEIKIITIVSNNFTYELDEDGNLREVIDNYFDITKVITSSEVINNGESLTVSHYSTSSSPKKLKDYAPKLKAGKSYVLSADTTGSIKYITLDTGNWNFGDTRLITPEDLESIVYWYSSGEGTTATISSIKIIEA